MLDPRLAFQGVGLGLCLFTIYQCHWDAASCEPAAVAAIMGPEPALEVVCDTCIELVIFTS